MCLLEEQVLEFIQRRFSDSFGSHWMDGNCYYFAVILRDRFSSYNPYLVYDVCEGHFLCCIEGHFYDWKGKHDYDLETQPYLIKWDTFSEYDEFQRQRIQRDCIQ